MPDLNFADLILAHEDEGPKTFETKELYRKGIDFELAMHEASHFVFDCLMLKYTKGFKSIVEAIVSSNNVNECRISGVEPDIPDGHKHDFFWKKFYLEDKNRLVARIICTIAGNASYKVFIDSRTSFFIGVPNEGRTLINYYSIDTVPLTLPNADFTKINKYLGYVGIENINNRRELMHLYLEKTQDLMKIPAIDNSIKYVKNILLKNDGKVVSGDTIVKMITHVQRFTHQVPFKSFLKELHDSTFL